MNNIPPGSPINAQQAIDLQKLFKIKILTGDDPDKFAKEFEKMVRDGWVDKGTHTNISWSESQGQFKFGYSATLVKRGA